MKLPNPEEYIKLFNIKEDIISCFYEITQRQLMEKDGFHEIELIYVDSQWFFNKNDLKFYNFDDEKINQVLDLVINRGEKLYGFTKTLNYNFSNLEDNELFNILSNLLNNLAEFMRIVDIPVYISNFFEGNTLKLIYEKGFSGHDFDILTHPNYNTYHQRRKYDLALLKKNKITKEEFKNKWSWSEMILFKKKLVDDHFIDEQLSHLDDPDKIISELDENHKKAKIEYDKLYSKLDVILRKKADLIQKFLYVRDYRFELYIRSTYNSIKIIEEIAKRLNLTYNEIIFMTPDELIKKEIPFDLHKRMEAFIFYKDNIYTGDEVNKWKELFNKKQDIDFVEGKGVSKGKIKGVAKIVLNADEAHKIEKGDIIICDITTPDYMHALHKVSAIVANIGGFTSHSAIVAREFNIPCVVGTKHATNIFKDNDIVEVDADKGIVRKIK